MRTRQGTLRREGVGVWIKTWEWGLARSDALCRNPDAQVIDSQQTDSFFGGHQSSQSTTSTAINSLFQSTYPVRECSNDADLRCPDVSNGGEWSSVVPAENDKAIQG